MWVSRKCLKCPILWGPGPRGYGDTATSFSQFCVNKTYRETLAFPKGATSRKREQPKPKQRGFETHFSYPLSEKV